jgi:exosortase A-associated hydrolase 1
MRQMINFPCGTDLLAGTLDPADGTTGLLIVSGGNEIRSGAYAGQASMAQHFSALGIPVFRFDRRGVGDSEGVNRGFAHNAEDIHAALLAFQRVAPGVRHIVAFGNCDAATALLLHTQGPLLGGLVLANPWTIDAAAEDEAAPVPDASVIRARYWNRIKNPRSLLDFLSGNINLRKLAYGLRTAAKPVQTSILAHRVAEAMARSNMPMRLVIAERDTTAMAFMTAWKSAAFGHVRRRPNIRLGTYPTASHSFADTASRAWLYAQILKFIKQPR